MKDEMEFYINAAFVQQLVNVFLSMSACFRKQLRISGNIRVSERVSKSKSGPRKLLGDVIIPYSICASFICI